MKRIATTTVAGLLVGSAVLAGTAMTADATPNRPSGGQAQTHQAENRGQQKQLTRAWLQLWNGDYRLAERIVSPDVRVHAALLDGGDGSAVKGPAGMVDLIKQIRSAFPDLR